MTKQKKAPKAPSPRRSGRQANTMANNDNPASGKASSTVANLTDQPAELNHNAVTDEHLRDNADVSRSLDQTAPSPGNGISGNEDSGGGEAKIEHRKWVESVKTDTLKPHPLSEKIYGAADHPSLRASVEDVGIQTPLMVSKVSGYVLSGNSRLAVAKELKMEEVPVIYREDNLTPEEEEDLIITSNAGRDKSREMRAREYREIKRIEIALVKRHKPAAGKNGSGPNLDPTANKSRHKAAERVGESASTLDKGLKVVEAADKLAANGKTDEAKALLTVLNTESYDAAFKKAQVEGFIPATQKKAVAAPASVPEGTQVAAANPKPVKTGDIDNEPKAKDKAKDKVDSAPVATSSNAKEARGPEHKPERIAIDEDVTVAVDRVGGHLDAIMGFILRSKVVRRMSEEQKAQMGKDIGKLNRLANEAGIMVVAN